MTCADHRIDIWRRLDGERVESAVDSHLADCAPCRSFAVQAAQLNALLPRAFAAAEPASLSAAVMARLRAEPRPLAVSERPFYAAAFASALLVYAASDFAGFAGLLLSARALIPEAAARPSVWAGSLLLSPLDFARAAADALRSSAAVLPSAWALPLIAVSAGLWILVYVAVRRTEYRGG